MSEKTRDPTIPEAGKQILPRRHDPGSGANETVDGLDATTENSGTPPRTRLLEPVPGRSRKRRSSTALIWPVKYSYRDMRHRYRDCPC